MEIRTKRKKEKKTLNAHTKCNWENQRGRRRGGGLKGWRSGLSCRCNRTFTTAEHPVGFNYLAPFSLCVPVVAVEVVKDDNYTPAVETHAPPNTTPSSCPPFLPLQICRLCSGADFFFFFFFKLSPVHCSIRIKKRSQMQIKHQIISLVWCNLHFH